MVEQIEYANVLVLNKTDLCNEEQLIKIEDHLALFNPSLLLYVHAIVLLTSQR